jgi:2-methylcitrate dehydratase PrpD
MAMASEGKCILDAGPTKRLAQWIAKVDRDDIPHSAILKAQELIVDWVGAALAGSTEELAEVAYSVTDLVVPDLRVSTLLTQNLDRTSPLQAAFVNGFTSHILELDDVHRSAMFHPAAVVIPAALALGEKMHVSGLDLLTAIVVGYEVGIRIGQAAGESHYETWHTTGTCGVFAAAAAAGKLLNLDENAMCWALGNAGTQAAGLWQFLEDGALSKPLHPGRAAYSGLLAALMAAKGFTGPHRILEGKKGFLKATSSQYDLSEVFDRLGETYRINDVSIKPYPSCRHSHPQIDAAREIARRPDFSHLRIDSVHVLTYSAAVAVAGGKGQYPSVPADAKFHSPYCIARALQNGTVGLRDFDERVIESDKSTKALVNRITIGIGEEFERRFPKAWGARVEVRMTDDRLFSSEVRYAKGDPENPLTEDELYEKYSDLAESALGRVQARLLWERLADMREIDDVSTIFVL